MTNEEQLQIELDTLLLIISGHKARIAAYELEIKELKAIVPFSKECPDCGFPRKRMDGPPPGSTLLSESQHTLAARISREEI